MLQNNLSPYLAKKFFAVYIILLCLGCEKEKIEKPPTWFAVHLSDGMTQYFLVEETKYIAFEPPQTRTYYLKMVFWEDKLLGEKQTFRVEYYAASSLTMPWKLDSMSLVAQTPASFAVLEKNQWHTKLQFPVFLSQSWPIHAGILGQNSPFAQITQLFFEKKLLVLVWVDAENYFVINCKTAYKS